MPRHRSESFLRRLNAKFLLAIAIFAMAELLNWIPADNVASAQQASFASSAANAGVVTVGVGSTQVAQLTLPAATALQSGMLYSGSVCFNVSANNSNAAVNSMSCSITPAGAAPVLSPAGSFAVAGAPVTAATANADAATCAVINNVAIGGGTYTLNCIATAASMSVAIGSGIITVALYPASIR